MGINCHSHTRKRSDERLQCKFHLKQFHRNSAQATLWLFVTDKVLYLNVVCTRDVITKFILHAIKTIQHNKIDTECNAVVSVLFGFIGVLHSTGKERNSTNRLAVAVAVRYINSRALRCDKRQCNEFYLIKCRNMNLTRGRMKSSSSSYNNIKYKAIHYKHLYEHDRKKFRPIYYNKRAITITIIYLTAAKTEITQVHTRVGRFV